MHCTYSYDCVHCGEAGTVSRSTLDNIRNGVSHRTYCPRCLHPFTGKTLGPYSNLKQIGKHKFSYDCVFCGKSGTVNIKTLGNIVRGKWHPTSCSKCSKERKTSSGYVSLYMPKHPNATIRGYILEHRLRMAEHLGRPLLPEETVHHGPGGRLCNELSNLEPRTGAHPAGYSVNEVVKYAYDMLKLYGPGLLKRNANQLLPSVLKRYPTPLSDAQRVKKPNKVKESHEDKSSMY